MISWSLSFIIIFSTCALAGYAAYRVEKGKAEIEELEAELAYLRGAVESTVATLRRNNIDRNIVADALEAAL
jgi:hypothetical protein